MTEASILIVDDEKNIRLLLRELLVKEGHQVLTAKNGEIALNLIEQRRFDLILLDLKMPGIDGIQVLRALRQQGSEAIVIMLTAHATLETAVEALRQGAHDYLFKPVSSKQFLDSVHRGLQLQQKTARQHALITQLGQIASNLAQLQDTAVPAETSSAPSDSTREQLLRYGSFVLDQVKQVVTADGHLLDLSPTEFELLTYLVQQAPQVVSPPEIVQAVQGYQVETWEAGNIVRQHIFNLRRKIQTAGGNPEAIHTVRGKGYVIRA